METTTTTAALSVEQIAKICHQANKAYCEALGDMSQKSWEETTEDIRQSAIRGVNFRLENPGAPPSAQHDAWKQGKVEEGWIWGTEKNPEAKTHPCIVDYVDLPEEQRRKDTLFQAVVDSMVPRPGTVCIDVHEFNDLKKDEAFLRSLEGAGVDNWSGYSHAQDSFKENYPEYQEA